MVMARETRAPGGGVQSRASRSGPRTLMPGCHCAFQDLTPFGEGFSLDSGRGYCYSGADLRGKYIQALG